MVQVPTGMPGREASERAHACIGGQTIHILIPGQIFIGTVSGQRARLKSICGLAPTPRMQKYLKMSFYAQAPTKAINAAPATTLAHACSLLFPLNIT
jgi:hypothetical protein